MHACYEQKLMHARMLLRKRECISLASTQCMDEAKEMCMHACMSRHRGTNACMHAEQLPCFLARNTGQPHVFSEPAWENQSSTTMHACMIDHLSACVSSALSCLVLNDNDNNDNNDNNKNTKKVIIRMIIASV